MACCQLQKGHLDIHAFTYTVSTSRTCTVRIVMHDKEEEVFQIALSHKVQLDRNHLTSWFISFSKFHKVADCADWPI